MPKRILAVDDDENILNLEKTILEQKGFHVVGAQGGAEALKLLGEQSFDLVLLDVMMPEVDGFEVCQRMRRDGDTTPVLMLTARNQPDDVVYGLKLGADDYVTKPFDLAELLARVEGLLRRQHWSRQEPTPSASGAAGARTPQTRKTPTIASTQRPSVAHLAAVPTAGRARIATSTATARIADLRNPRPKTSPIRNTRQPTPFAGSSFPRRRFGALTRASSSIVSRAATWIFSRSARVRSCCPGGGASTGVPAELRICDTAAPISDARW